MITIYNKYRNYCTFAIGNLHATLCKILQASGGAIAGDYFFS